MVQSYAWAGEDAIAFSLLRGATGSYVDVGAHLPMRASNTYLFYEHGWSGVCGTGLSVDPASGLAFVVMTQTAVEGMIVSDEFVRTFYEQRGAR